MDDRGFGEAIQKVNTDTLAGPKSQDRPDVAVRQRLNGARRSIEHSRLVPPHTGRSSWEHRHLGRSRTKLQLHVRRGRGTLGSRGVRRRHGTHDNGSDTTDEFPSIHDHLPAAEPRFKRMGCKPRTSSSPQQAEREAQPFSAPATSSSTRTRRNRQWSARWPHWPRSASWVTIRSWSRPIRPRTSDARQPEHSAARRRP